MRFLDFTILAQTFILQSKGPFPTNVMGRHMHVPWRGIDDTPPAVLYCSVANCQLPTANG
ncbi:hypothetical protein EAF00_003925 [Botryotinia globosa]|nr:hypothetical protein EAF00_003925 [Botryotinia globosa]